MNTTDLPPTSLPDDQLLAHAAELAAHERRATADLIAALAEIAARRLYLPLGYSSLHAYCVQVLHLSSDAAWDRIEAARASQRFPSILERLANGSLSLSALRLLLPSLTVDNHEELLEKASYKTKREVWAMVAGLRPHSVPYRTVITPVSGNEFRIQVTVSRETHDKLQRAQDLLRHAVPDGDAATVLDRALTLLIKELEKKKAGVTSRPRPPRRLSPRSRVIPAAVRRKVWARDEGRCAYMGTNGRCGSRRRVEFHHVVPFAIGGPPTVENVEARCKAHNSWEWDEYVEEISQTEFQRMMEDESGLLGTGPGTSDEQPLMPPVRRRKPRGGGTPGA